MVIKLGVMIALAALALLAEGTFRASRAGNAPAYGVDVVVAQAAGKRVEGKVRSHTLLADQPKEFAGTDAGPTPPETYAFSLGACLVSAMRFVAELENLPVGDIRARVRGVLDFSKAMGIDMEKRAGFAELSIAVSFTAPWSAREKEAFVERVAARCPICDNAQNPASLRVVVE